MELQNFTVRELTLICKPSTELFAAIREAAILALTEKRDVSFEFNEKIYKISPAEIVEFVLKGAG
jgi:hypothetical protein